MTTVQRRLGTPLGPTSEALQTEQLFEHTGRWLFNEETNKRLRHSPFNAEALEAIACRVTEARGITNWTKIGEGSNKVFRLELDNGRKVVLRIPNPIVPNVELTTASEVATMEYVRERFGVPEGTASHFPVPPKVLAWDRSPTNDVGSAYIIHEFVEGVPAMDWWLSDFQRPVSKILWNVFSLEKALLEEPFALYGSLYFKEDVEEKDRDQPLYSDEQHAAKYPALAAKYRSGPSTDRQWWRDVYGKVEGIDRGPWPNVESILRSAISLQLKAIETGVAFQNPHIRSKPQDAPNLTRLLNMLLTTVDYLVPADRRHTRPALNHPSLTAKDMITNANGEDGLVGIIDWQGAAILPFTHQTRVPTLFRAFRVGKQDEADELRTMNMENCLEARSRIYGNLVASKMPDRTAHFVHKLSMTNMLHNILRTVSDGGHGLRGILADLSINWWAIVQASGKQALYNPIPLSMAEIFAIEAESTREEAIDQFKNDTTFWMKCDIWGAISDEEYEEGKNAMAVVQAICEDPSTSKPCDWPFYDGCWAMDLC
ncbi:protein kinase subdomain-containing protein PKL/CAK/Fmp29 [Coprinopsis cinerea okayama7|uniref:Altered inheritance of mitochondria protein 9, mitochondrial n=1 Tax=Coprinopsis cinerea (strain Okayama-7 / 130 / ATCC MYA-4618 / FGSC 9003) TaxID=240176 RepID=A8NH21_COPC7|nr:protein kinase subdomain-containing protein PKL/CAK/Fmp29 [Coprinopsis cinerea okayama7\|eukprot:XP_001833659.1 protein kinase subdomain-containing protein PKL/CAK/Fmp29 [Coprinopsis cinerea okayama7\